MGQRLESLTAAVRNRDAILFAGAGVSMSAGLPSWKQLIDHLVGDLGLDLEDPAAASGYQVLAEYHRLTHGGLGRLREWIERTWSVSEEAVRNSPLHKAIVDLDFPIIYTTNYDTNLEAAYRVYGRPYVKVATAADIARAKGDVTQIVKFHGDFEDERSIVIGETDYLDRLAFDSPLDIKFRADALGKTVLFVGYSVSDINIRLLLHRLWQTWQRSGYESERPSSYVFMPRHNPVHEAVLNQWGIRLVSEEQDDAAEALLCFLTKLKERVSRIPPGP